MPNFAVGYYIRHHDSYFYACLDDDQLFFNLENYTTYFKAKG